MQHASDFSRHNAPAYPADVCDCGAEPIDEHNVWARDQWDKAYSIGNSGQARREAGRRMRKLLSDLHRQCATVWQPIETAPMDGTEVILFYPHVANGFVTAGYFIAATDNFNSHWYADQVNGGASPPTHWMPLPHSPQR